MKLSMRAAQDVCTDMLFHIDRICEENEIHYFAYFGTLLGAIRHKGPIPWDADVDIYVPEPEMELFISKLQENLPEKYWVNYRNNKGHSRCFARIGLSGYKTEILHIDVFRLCGFPSALRAQKTMMRRGHMLYVLWKAKVVDPNFYYRNRPFMRFKAKVLRSLLTFVSVNRIIDSYDALCNRYSYDAAEYVGFPIGSDKYLYKKTDVLETIRTEYDGIMIRIPRENDKLLKHMYGDYLKYPPKEEQIRGLNAHLQIREL